MHLHRRSFILCLTTLLSLLTGCSTTHSPATPQPPFFQSTPLYHAGDLGYTTFRVPGLICTPKGTLLLTVSARKNGYTDWTEIHLLLRRSTDNGKTWLPPQLLVHIPKTPVDNACLFTAGSRVYMTYMVNYAHCYLITSDDQGATWSPPRDITSAFDTYRTRDHFNWQVIATGPGHGIVLRNGRFLIPILLSTSHSHRPSITSTIYSDDQGATWHAGDVVTQNLPESKNPCENVLIQLADGSVMDNIRCESPAHRRLVATSPDGSTHWTKPTPDPNLFDPVCFASLARYSFASPTDPNSKNIILFCNPNSQHADPIGNKAHMNIRKNITLRLSYDEGKSWPLSKVIDPDLSGYTDLAVSPDHTIFLAYEHGSTDSAKTFSPQSLNIARLNLPWLISPPPSK
ncbi:MAG TPA: sialidase family protein [Tepidisphaeraceae bacterium]|jgi:sialidase-1|nr:sialidase family protein [Tepidisphaeraceae bacterium]